jgi:predicted nucleotidyltransferase
MVVSPADVANRLREKARADAAVAEARARRLRGKLSAATEILRAAGAGRVWLFGSLASGVPHAESDVDLAVDGFPCARYFDVLAALMTLFGTRVDLVTLHDAPASLRERIAATGREL